MAFDQSIGVDEDGIVIQPFLKWAGGKRWLIEKHKAMLEIPHKRFIEPFVGSGAVFFSIAPKISIISDANEDLIETYRTIRDNWFNVQEALRIHQEKHSKDYYYNVRASRPKTPIGRASRFIYLNRTCWNGLYRVNRNGQFNVPIGTKSKVLLDTDNFEATSSVLRNATIIGGDFESVVDLAEADDLIFVDPPYTVKHNHNGFIKYNESLFSWDDQIRLKNAIARALNRGAKAVITNAFHDCIKELYEGMGEHIQVSRPSVISGSAAGRGVYEELVIKCA